MQFLLHVGSCIHHHSQGTKSLLIALVSDFYVRSFHQSMVSLLHLITLNAKALQFNFSRKKKKKNLDLGNQETSAHREQKGKSNHGAAWVVQKIPGEFMQNTDFSPSPFSLIPHLQLQENPLPSSFWDV